MYYSINAFVSVFTIFSDPLANLNIQEEEEEKGMFKPTFAYIKSQKVFVTLRLKIRVKKKCWIKVSYIRNERTSKST